jgi:hypothetical protein
MACFPKIGIYFLLFQEETPDEDKTFSVVYSLKKVATFYNCHSLGNGGIWDSIFKDRSDAKDGNKTLPEEVISAFGYHTLWTITHSPSPRKYCVIVFSGFLSKGVSYVNTVFFFFFFF